MDEWIDRGMAWVLILATLLFWTTPVPDTQTEELARGAKATVCDFLLWKAPSEYPWHCD
jgi:hypothetical protein